MDEVVPVPPSLSNTPSLLRPRFCDHDDDDDDDDEALEQDDEDDHEDEYDEGQPGR